MTTPDTERARVTQADRDAAADLLTAWEGVSTGAVRGIAAGALDKHDFVQAFARHREQALASRDEAGGEWRPIEEAPKDGTEVLLWGRCERDGQFFAYDCNVGWYDDGSFGDKGWCARDLPIEPTHFMPLPDPPRTLSVTYRGEGG